MLFNGSDGVFPYIGKQGQQQREYQDVHESNKKGHQINNGTKWHLFWV
jgi:hypothetical protein